MAKLSSALGLSLLVAALGGSLHARADEPAPLAPSTPLAPPTPLAPSTPLAPPAPLAPATPLPQLAPPAPLAPATPLPQLAPPAPLAPAKPLPQLAPPAPPRAVTPPRPVTWYGWETLLAGGGTILLPLALLRSQPQTGLVIGAVLSPMVTASMHVIHGDDVKAYVSAPVSYAMMGGGAALAAALVCGPRSREGCTARWAFTGIILGGASAVVLDAVALAWGGPPLMAPTPVKKKARLLPFVVPLQGGAAAGIGGTF